MHSTRNLGVNVGPADDLADGPTFTPGFLVPAAPGLFQPVPPGRPKMDRSNLPQRPAACLAQIGLVPFLALLPLFLGEFVFFVARGMAHASHWSRKQCARCVSVQSLGWLRMGIVATFIVRHSVPAAGGTASPLPAAQRPRCRRHWRQIAIGPERKPDETILLTDGCREGGAAGPHGLRLRGGYSLAGSHGELGRRFELDKR